MRVIGLLSSVKMELGSQPCSRFWWARKSLLLVRSIKNETCPCPIWHRTAALSRRILSTTRCCWSLIVCVSKRSACGRWSCKWENCQGKTWLLSWPSTTCCQRTFARKVVLPTRRIFELFWMASSLTSPCGRWRFLSCRAGRIPVWLWLRCFWRSQNCWSWTSRPIIWISRPLPG